MKSHLCIFPTALIFSLLLLFSGCATDENGKNGFERTIEGINNAGKKSAEAAHKLDTAAAKFQKSANKVAEKIKSYSK